MKQIILAVTLAFLSINTNALEKKNFEDISINDLSFDTQAQPVNEGDSHLSLVWWIPFEYWASVLSRDTSVSDTVKEDMLDVLREYTVIAVVQSDISSMGAFNFYGKEKVKKALRVSYVEDGNTKFSMFPEKNISADMNLLMEQMSPVLKAAMGNMGANFHFFIYKDLNDKGGRIIDPYIKGTLNVSLSKTDGEELKVELKTPLNSLYVPRICPNGEKAHVSWNYCPWSGDKI